MNQRGFALPALLYLAIILSAISLASYSLAAKSGKIAAIRQHAQRATHTASILSLQEILSDDVTLQPGLNCREFTGEAAVTAVKRTLCVAHNAEDLALLSNKVIDGGQLPLGTLFPSFNYNRIFENFAPCAFLPFSGGNRTEHGLSLSAGSHRSWSTCTEIPAQIGDFSVQGNIAADDPLTMNGTLAALGYLDLRGQVRVDGPSMIIAGGDLYVEALLPAALPGADVTLISASGMVQVNALSPSLKVKVIAWAGAYLAGSSANQSSPFRPQLQRLQPIGFAK